MRDVIQKAGAIILSQENPEKILLLYNGTHKDWGFPKGHIESIETAGETVHREIQEETGLLVRVFMELPSTRYVNSTTNMPVLLHLFLVRSENDALLRKEFEGDELAWVYYKDVLKKLSFQNLQSYFEDIFPVIEKVIASQ